VAPIFESVQVKSKLNPYGLVGKGRLLAGPVAALQLGPATPKLELVVQPFVLVAQIHVPVALPLMLT
jgi:hypothetical protein